MPISLVLADDHPLLLKGLETLFSTEPDFTVLAYCTDGDQAMRAARRYAPDILVLDLKMPRKDGWAVLRELQQENPQIKPVVLTATLSEDEALEAFRLGVRGVVLKEMAPLLLLQCLRKVHAGETWLEKRSFVHALGKMLQREEHLRQMIEMLTLREITLTRLTAKGLNNRQIAQELHISEGTVKVHLHNIYSKLEVKNRVELLLYVQEYGLAQ